MVSDFDIKDFNGNKKKDIDTGEHLGYFYVLDCGNRVKIGSTKSPVRRYKELYKFLCSYGNLDVTTMYISKIGTNYFQNEAALHKIFNSYQLGNTEMYKISVKEALERAKTLSVKDASERLLQEDKKALSEIDTFVAEMYGINLEELDSPKESNNQFYNDNKCINYLIDSMDKLIDLNKKQSENILLLTSNLNNNDYWINEEIIKEQYYDKPITLHKFIKIFSSCRKANVGYKRLIKYLRKYSFITYKSLNNRESYLAPTKESINRGLFKMADLVKNNIKHKQLLITAEGQDLLDDVLSQNMDKLMSPDL